MIYLRYTIGEGMLFDISAQLVSNLFCYLFRIIQIRMKEIRGKNYRRSKYWSCQTSSSCLIAASFYFFCLIVKFEQASPFTKCKGMLNFTKIKFSTLCELVATGLQYIFIRKPLVYGLL